MSSPESVFRISLVGLLSLAIAMGIGRFAFTPLLPLMRADGLLDIANGGVLASVHFLGYWLGAVSAAKLRCSPKATLRISLIAIGVCTLAMGMTENFIAWLIIRWIAGVCSAFVLVLVSNFYIGSLAGLGRPDMQGWIFSGVGAGIAAAGLSVLALMAGHIGGAPSWRTLGIATLIAVFAVCALMGSEIPDSSAAAQSRKSQRSPLAWGVVMAYGAVGFGYAIPATYLPVMAREIVRSPGVFGWSWPVFGLAAFLSTLVAARIERRFPSRRIWAASQMVMAAGLLLPAVFPHILAIVIAGICVGGTFMIITMAGMKEAHRLAPPNDVMRHIAVMTAAFATGQMVGPVFAGFIHDLTGSLSPSLTITSAILVIAATPLIAGAPNKEILRT